MTPATKWHLHLNLIIKKINWCLVIKCLTLSLNIWIWCLVQIHLDRKCSKILLIIKPTLMSMRITSKCKDLRVRFIKTMDLLNNWYSISSLKQTRKDLLSILSMNTAKDLAAMVVCSSWMNMKMLSRIIMLWIPSQARILYISRAINLTLKVTHSYKTH